MCHLHRLRWSCIQRQYGETSWSEEYCPWFPHPARHSKNFFPISDATRGLQLLRNLMADKGAFCTSHYHEIWWSYITELHKLQDTESSTAVNKLWRAHIIYRKHIMKVLLAVQIFSALVSTALNFSRMLGLLAFQGSEGTVMLLEDINE